jgi:3-oxoacyl-[acyl-carrier-protein] synthase II
MACQILTELGRLSVQELVVSSLLKMNMVKLLAKGPRRVSPFFIPQMIADIASGHVSMRYNLRGPNFTTVSACASANHAIAVAYNDIVLGNADIMVTGGAEAPISEMALAGFGNMKALSTRNDDPSRASRPFDKNRDGFVMGEGSGVLVLEELTSAQKRGAAILGEIFGVGYSADAYHLTARLQVVKERCVACAWPLAIYPRKRWTISMRMAPQLR